MGMAGDGLTMSRPQCWERKCPKGGPKMNQSVEAGEGRKSERLLTIREAAERLGLKSVTLRAWRLRRINLPFVTAGGAVRVSAEAVEAFIRSNTIAPRE